MQDDPRGEVPAYLVAKPGQVPVARMTKVMELEKLRSRQKLTQAALATRMGLSQRRVSAIEHTGSGDLKLDTLRRYVASLGGQLEITAIVDGDRIPLPLR